MHEHFDLEARDIIYKTVDGLGVRTILSIERLKIAQGSRLALQGSSGAGKTTLLKVLSGIIRSDIGLVRWGKTIVSDLNETNRDAWRGENCGFLFQDFGLLEGLTAVENVLLPETFKGRISTSAQQRARELLDRFGIREIAVMNKHDAVRSVNVERLAFFVTCSVALRRVAHLTDAGCPEQIAHVARSEHISH